MGKKELSSEQLVGINRWLARLSVELISTVSAGECRKKATELGISDATLRGRLQKCGIAVQGKSGVILESHRFILDEMEEAIVEAGGTDKDVATMYEAYQNEEKIEKKIPKAQEVLRSVRKRAKENETK